MQRSALLVLTGNSGAAILGLLRNLVVAALIPVADYGIAATFAVVVAVVEMATAFGLQQQIIQAKDGEDPRLQAGLQGFQLLRGVFSSLVLLVIAVPFASLMRVPEVTWGYQMMALLPLLGALQHFDVHRLTRAGRFGPMVLAGTVPLVVSLAAIWPLAMMFGDWRVMLFSILLQTVTSLAISHLVAERPYKISFDRTVIARGLRFGWPLMLNNVLLFGVFQGDKIIVGRELGLEMLAIFAMGLTLTLPPTLVLTRSVQSLFLPVLSRASGDDARFRRLTAACTQATAISGLVLAVGVVFVGEVFLSALYGEKFAALLPLLVLFALTQAMRMLKAGPAIVALAAGESKNAMQTNIPRVVMLPVAWYIAVTYGDIYLILVVALVAELAGLLLAYVLLYRSIGPAAFSAFATLAASAAGLCVLGVWAVFRPEGIGAQLPYWWVTAGVFLATCAAVGLSVELRRYIFSEKRP